MQKRQRRAGRVLTEASREGPGGALEPAARQLRTVSATSFTFGIEEKRTSLREKIAMVHHVRIAREKKMLHFLSQSPAKNSFQHFSFFFSMQNTKLVNCFARWLVCFVAQFSVPCVKEATLTIPD